jgi:diadenosine tetraphosphatase ApaH/serine/threonine PP2A family protein phosphatase
VKSRSEHVVLGNHEATFLNASENLELMCTSGQKAMAYTQSRLGDEDRRRLAEWPVTKKVFGKRMLLAHGSFVKRDCWAYLDERDVVLDELKGLPESARLCLVGHSHVPLVYGTKRGLRPEITDGMALAPGEKFILNCGSVGQPRDGDCRASYGLIEADDGFEADGSPIRFSLMRVFYDIAAVGREIDKAGLPHWLHERLYRGE